MLDFNYKTLTLMPDTEGEVVTTLISPQKNTGNRDTVLYIHGFIDYFFHPHVASAFLAQNMDFYALDMRKYGRSLLPHQTANYCEDIAEYFEDITSAITEIQKNLGKDDKLFILAHSTGCISASMYLNLGEKKDAISALILNSPFLSMPINPLATKSIYLASKAIVKIKPRAKLPKNVNHIYPETLHKDFKGEWDFDLSLKPLDGFPVYLKWAIAIAEAHRFLRTQSKIEVPVLSMFSAKSSKAKKHGVVAHTTDTVLKTKHMKKLSPKLGSQVTLLPIKGGKHDLFLSQKDVREKALKQMFAWLNPIRQK